MTDLLSNLPRIKVDELPIYNYSNDVLGGFLNKKASKNSTFSKGKWQKRWFSINHNLDTQSNYSLSYYYLPSDRIPRQVYELKKAAVILSGGLSFTIEFDNDVSVVLGADSADLMNDWVDTLQKVISVATVRNRLMTNDKHLSDKFNNNENEDTLDHTITNPSNTNPFQSRQRKLPTLRFHIDTETIPPGSPQRRQFVELFIDEVSKALDVSPLIIEVLSVKPAPNRSRMTLIEFDVNMYLDPANQLPDYSVTVDDEGNEIEVSKEIDDEQLQEHEDEMDKQRYKNLFDIDECLRDENSLFYDDASEVTKYLDPTYSKYLIDELDENIEMYSSVPRVLETLKCYQDIQLPKDYLDVTHFTIYVCYEGHIKPFSVPNPIALPRRNCAIYPFEIKQALGLTGTMQELWVEPLALVPRNMPKSLSQPIVFEPSARLDNSVIIHTSKLKADLTYDVQCEDYRGEILKSLTDEELDTIKETFDEYDVNGDGSISKLEMEELIRARTQDRIDYVEDKYDEMINGRSKKNKLAEDDLLRAEESKRQYLQHIEESKTKMIRMFDAADINGDGMLSFSEFMLMEAWWMRCTLNPEKAHLF